MTTASAELGHTALQRMLDMIGEPGMTDHDLAKVFCDAELDIRAALTRVQPAADVLPDDSSAVPTEELRKVYAFYKANYGGNVRAADAEVEAVAKDLSEFCSCAFEPVGKCIHCDAAALLRRLAAERGAK